MLNKTHFVFGILFGLLALPLVTIDSFFRYVIYFLLIALGVLLPDMDHSESYINRKLIITKIFAFVFKHRGFLHSIYFPLILGIIMWLYFGFFYGFALFIGYISHILSDALTVSGVNLLHPFSHLHIRGFVKTGSLLERIIFYFVIGLIIIRLYYLLF